MEEETIDEIDNVEKTGPEPSGDLIDFDLVPPSLVLEQVGYEIQNDQQGIDDADAPIQVEIDDSPHEQLPIPEVPSPIPLRRSIGDRQPSTRYSINEYVLLTDGGEPECFEETMEDEHKNEWVEAMQDEMKSLHENHTFELVKFPMGKRALNNRGEDTRNNFTSFLNLVLKDRGINVFIDSETLWAGEAIGPSCLRAIERSKISIPIFSGSYAHSKWCLLELAHILQCHISNGQIVLPIFFDLDPSHVRNQTGSFEEAFREHEKNFEPFIVESWREALRVIGNLKGEVIDKTKDQAKIVELLGKRALDELVSSTHLAECKYPIGIDSRVGDLLSLLNNGSNDVQFVGICGIDGIGKTTIAKVVYNCILLNFNRRSFLSDIKEQAKQCMGLASLQKRLLKDIFKTDFDIGHYHRGKKLIEERLCEENVLLVLDDVDSKEQVDALAGGLNWFGQGSRVIITSRDEHILNVANIDKDKIYWSRELDHVESLQLFSLHAFSMDEPPHQDFVQLSRDVVHYSGGLPSILEVLGSYLSDINNKEEWRSILRKLNTGKASISSLASLRKQRKKTRLMTSLRKHRKNFCPFASSVWKRILSSCWPSRRRILRLSREWIWVDMAFGGSTIYDTIGKLAFGAAINHIWMEHNIRR
ncbi:TMV resistance protein N-like [Macadamia integrifolia]|uniref:TMV resistance protein N-like n=1 Tax=Macadamia integrifolia TaxID=60698 RepID=UPI001C4FD61D|nr:TMV resistance protein N-like [Macadamia integrifolia]